MTQEPIPPSGFDPVGPEGWVLLVVEWVAGADDWLGVMVGKIREGGATHPAQALYGELDQLNDYTAQYHHGEDVADATPDQIDPTELTGYTKRTLKIVNALQA